MWQHEIIESCKELNAVFRKEAPSWCMSRKCQGYIDVNSLSKVLESVPCIYFGKSDTYTNMLKPLVGVQIGLSVKFPFDCFLVEYEKVLEGDFEDGKFDSSKRALLVTTTKGFPKEIQDPTNYLYGEDFIVNGFFYLDEFKRFEPSLVTLSGKVNSSRYAAWPFQWFSPQYASFLREYPLSKKDVDKFTYELGEELGMLKVMIDFLNCKNVYTETVVPIERVNKKRIKNKKSPMLEYKVLKVQKGVPKVKYTSVTHPWSEVPKDIITAQHICRGHFKEYGEDGKLFGKYTGRFWWGPQVRGSAENGKIIKEYDVSQ